MICHTMFCDEIFWSVVFGPDICVCSSFRFAVSAVLLWASLFQWQFFHFKLSNIFDSLPDFGTSYKLASKIEIS